MPYIKDGKVVESKGFSLRDTFFSILNLIVFFFTSMLGTGTMDAHTSSFAATRKSGGSGGPSKANVKGFDKPAATGCAGGGG
jgi:hypothetical protein